jgi:BASS family bile acid:Na+ symporter
MIVTKLLLPAGLAFIMFAMGLTLKVGDFTRLLRRPLPVALGLAVQMALLPALAFALLQLFPLRPEYAVGVMILAACPGGITSNMITHIARGDTALSITLTAITSLAAMASVPFIVGLGLAAFMPQAAAGPLPAPKMAIGVFAVSTLPVIVGMAIHHLAPRLAERVERVARPLSIGVFALIVIAAFASQWRPMMENIGEIGPVVIALNVLIMAAGYALALKAGLPHPQRVAIAIEGGLQNGALGIFVAATLLANPAMMTPSITYALVMNVSAFVFILWLLTRRQARAA